MLVRQSLEFLSHVRFSYVVYSDCCVQDRANGSALHDAPSPSFFLNLPLSRLLLFHSFPSLLPPLIPCVGILKSPCLSLSAPVHAARVLTIVPQLAPSAFNHDSIVTCRHVLCASSPNTPTTWPFQPWCHLNCSDCIAHSFGLALLPGDLTGGVGGAWFWSSLPVRFPPLSFRFHCFSSVFYMIPLSFPFMPPTQ